MKRFLMISDHIINN